MRGALYWKDYRIFRDVFVGGLVLIVASYGLALMVLVMNGELGWTTFLGGGASLTRFFAILVGALFGGYAFAFEREERSDLFLAVLPVPRRAQLGSKLLLAVAALALYWGVSMAVLVGALASMGVTAHGILLSMRSMVDFVVASLMVFGIAWRFSTSARSPLTAAFSGLMALIPLCIAQAAATQLLGLTPFYFFSGATLCAMAAAGTWGVLSGNRRFLRNAPASAQAQKLSRWRRASAEREHAVAYSAGTPFAALLWKDYQLVKTSLWIGAFVILLPHGWSLLNGLGGDGTVSLGGCLLSIALCSLVFPFWAGQLMGGESVSRTTEFLRTLPIATRHALASRCLVLMAAPVTLSVMNTALLVYANNSAEGATVFGSRMVWADWYEAAELTTGLALANGALMALAAACFFVARGGRTLVGVILGIVSGPVVIAIWASLSTICVELGDGFLSPLGFVSLFGSVVPAFFLILAVLGSYISLEDAAA